MFSVAVITAGCPLHPFHDHLGMKALQVFFLRFLVAGRAVHFFVRSLLPALGVLVIFDMGVAI